MKKLLTLLMCLLLILSLSGCGQKKEEEKPSEPETVEPEQPVEVPSVKVIETTVDSTHRDGVKIPTYITLPADFDETKTYPLVVMIHGHHGNHNEWGGYDAISNGLAEKGLIAVTLDFSGCGASKEGIELNALSNMKNDVVDVADFMKANYKISKVGGFGYSMGGRIILELLNEDMYQFDTIEFVAPAESTEDLEKFFGGAENWEAMKAEVTDDHMASFMSMFGEQLLSKLFFEDIEKYMDADELASKAAAKYTGNSLCIYATDDNVVYPEVSQRVADAFGSTVVTVSKEGHSYSFYGSDPVVISTVNNASIDFFAAELLAK
ncbi:MAG: alpha/beta fold hydrolase [Erysipelotrichaceae bacterium]|nr:alpha/beta fold hydrolase [Erysipelotrichaceae bacterium]